MRKNKPTSKPLPKKLNFLITIHEPILSDDNLDWMDKILWSKINQLDGQNGCFASNKYLAEFMGMSRAWITNRLTQLKKKGYLFEKSFDGRKRTLRCITPYESDISLLKFSKQPTKNRLSDQNVPFIDKEKNNKNISHGTSNLFETKHLNLSSMLLRKQTKKHPSLMRNIPPSAKENGALEISKLERIDKYTFKEIKNALLWGIEDKFWSRQILSAASIRNKSRNQNTKFKNLFIAYLSDHKEYDTAAKPIPDAILKDISTEDQKIIEMIQEKYYPFDGFKLSEILPQMKIGYKKLSRAPGELRDFRYFVYQYIKFLKEQTWLNTPNLANFRLGGAVWKKFIEHLEDNRMVIGG